MRARHITIKVEGKGGVIGPTPGQRSHTSSDATKARRERERGTFIGTGKSVKTVRGPVDLSSARQEPPTRKRGGARWNGSPSVIPSSVDGVGK